MFHSFIEEYLKSRGTGSLTLKPKPFFSIILGENLVFHHSSGIRDLFRSFTQKYRVNSISSPFGNITTRVIFKVGLSI